jgi:hypothetical protein
MLERLETVGSTEPIVGEIVAEEAMKENGSYEQSVTLLIDLSVRAGDIKSVTFQFYNGRGTRSGDTYNTMRAMNLPSVCGVINS